MGIKCRNNQDKKGVRTYSENICNIYHPPNYHSEPEKYHSFPLETNRLPPPTRSTSGRVYLSWTQNRSSGPLDQESGWTLRWKDFASQACVETHGKKKTQNWAPWWNKTSRNLSQIDSTMNPQVFLVQSSSSRSFHGSTHHFPSKSPCFCHKRAIFPSFFRGDVSIPRGFSTLRGSGGLHPDLRCAGYHDFHGDRGAVDRQHQRLGRWLVFVAPRGLDGWNMLKW